MVVVRENENGDEIKVEVPAGSFEIDEPEVHDADRRMGTELVYRVSASPDGLGDVVWYVHEYPVGVVNYVDKPSIDGEVTEEPSFSLTLD